MRKLASLLLLCYSLLGFAVQGGWIDSLPVNPPAPVVVTDSGLRVLVTYPVDGKSLLPREQMALIDSVSFRAYLDDHCAKAGGVPEWRIVPDDAEFEADQPVWQKLMAVPRASSAWLVVVNGSRGESAPLPTNEAAALELIGRYAK
jgi:hypothetical protein